MNKLRKIFKNEYLDEGNVDEANLCGKDGNKISEIVMWRFWFTSVNK